ncbi:MAG TPA: hypothetical protein VLV45_15220 [Gemmatimonadales bacterium]|nr:hypothetical protein [Gemmatimonadales bacterium]
MALTAPDPSRRPTTGRGAATRLVFLAGAALVPFNYFIGIAVGDITIHLLEFWVVVLLAMTVLLQPRLLLETTDTPTLLLWTTFAFVLMSTVLATPAEFRIRGLLDNALLAINLLGFTLTYAYLRNDPPLWLRFARVTFGSSLIASVYLAARALSVAQSGVFLLPDSFVLGIGTVGGTYTAAFAALSMVGFTFGTTRLMRWIMVLGIIVHGMAASFALARGPWLALGIAFVACVILGLWVRPRLERPIVALARAGFATLLLLTVAFSTALENQVFARYFAPRVAEIGNLGSGSGHTRLTLFLALLDDVRNSPLFGHGAAAYRSIATLLGTEASISENFLLEILHAGGAAAAVPLGFAWLIVLLRAVRSTRLPGQRGITLACLACALALMLASLSNPAAWNASFWLLVAATAALRFTFPVTTAHRVALEPGVP